jgi:hypothetical protein
MEARFKYASKRSWMLIAPRKVNALSICKKSGSTHTLSTAQKASAKFRVLLGCLGLEVNLMAEKVNHDKGIESPIVFHVEGVDEVGLMNVANIQRLAEIGVLHAFGNAKPLLSNYSNNTTLICAGHGGPLIIF